MRDHAQNLAQKAGDRFRMGLNDASRGRVQVSSDTTVLFHFVAAPPVAKRPVLPTSVKSGWVKSIEPLFTLILTISFLFHAVSTFVVMNVDPPPPPSKEDLEKWIKKIAPLVNRH